MNYKEFLSAVVKEISQKVGPYREVRLQQVMKNNSVLYDSLLIIDPLINISPTIYLNPYYHRLLDGVSMHDIVSDIYQTYETYMPGHNVDTDFFMDYTCLKDKVIMKLISYEHNLEFLCDVPHVPHLDFAIIFQCLVKDLVESTGTITIRNSHMELWDVDVDTLYCDALRNTPQLLPPIFENVCDCLHALEKQLDPSASPVPPEEVPPMYVLTNSHKQNGATAILYPNLLKKIADRFYSDLFLLPSSIHEFLIVPSMTDDYKSELKRLTDLVQCVNETEVSDEEFLSDQAYLYKREMDTMFEYKKLNPAVC